MLGVPLEMVHRWWRVLLIYLTGVLAGSLAVSITDPLTYLAGASGGVYALITAHLSNVISNWSQMAFAPLRLATFFIVAGTDVGVAVYYRYTLQYIHYTYHSKTQKFSSGARHCSGNKTKYFVLRLYD